MKRYNPKDIEPKWQDKWAKSKIYQATEDGDKPKRYILEYFPYPSGAAMHVGHVRNYTIGDVMARHARMTGHNVLHPMGWDAFGLPAENYAIKNGISPAEAIKVNTGKFKRQLTQMGFSYDWSREINSSDPKYYRWTQWFFKLLLERGLAYQKDSLQWWCDTDKTVLANEQVENGKCWRCGNEVVKKPLKQWFFRITDYADRLAEDLDTVDWSDAIKTMQRNWIGKSSGAEVEFVVGDTPYVADDTLKFTPELTALVQSGEKTVTYRLEKKSLEVGSTAKLMTRYDEREVRSFAYARITNISIMKLRDLPLDYEGQMPYESKEAQLAAYQNYYDTNVTLDSDIYIYTFEKLTDIVTVFTTRPDTLFGATFMVLAPEHALVPQLTTDDKRSEIEAYITDTAKKSDVERQENKDKTGVFTGGYVINPATGQPIPVWIADYVLAGYGTGAIMAVPAHDERDYEFARRFDLPIRPVILPNSDRCVSYIMGTAHIRASDIEAIGGTVEQTTNQGNLWVSFPKTAAESYEKLIDSKMDSGFWNEYVGDKVVFIFKNKDNTTQRFVLSDETDATIRRLGDKLLGHPESGRSVWDWLGANEFYSQLFLRGGEGVMVNSGEYDGMQSDDARERCVADLAEAGMGRSVTNYKIRDWLISRQRYWGAPIPVIHCPDCGTVPVPDDELPVTLPEVESYQPTGEGTSVLASVTDWVNVPCPKCGGAGKRETDTMDGFACSSWYFLRFADPHNDQEPFARAKADFWLPVDDYIGGAEHAVMHLLYARMWTKVMYDAGLISFDEPFQSLRNQGMILAPDGRKMSKSWGNTITPDDIIDQGYGADAIRVMELFIGPWDQSANWSVEGMGGCFRFLQRIWTLVQEFLAAEETDKNSDAESALRRITHKTIRRVTLDLRDMGFNTAVAAMMEMVNELYRIKAAHSFRSRAVWQESFDALLQLLAPFAPHITDELWQQLGHDSSIHLTNWPDFDEQYLAEDVITIAVQVNGKVRSQVQVAPDSTESQVEAAARADEKAAGYLDSKETIKLIYVPGKLISFVVR